MISATPDWIPAKPHEYKGINYRSKLEARWAEWLDEQSIKFEYEKKKFILPKDFFESFEFRDRELWYCPDFYLPEYDLWLEVKGYMDDLSLEKITRFASHRFLPNQLFVGFSEVGKVLDATRAYYRDYDPQEYRFEQFDLSKILKKNKAMDKVQKVIKKTGNYSLGYRMILMLKEGVIFND